MSRLFRGAAIGALAAAGVLALAGAASAQTYGRLVVFGDSLSDNGNLYADIAQPPPPYYQGRRSNGPVFTELLGFNTGVFADGDPVNGSINLAYIGARTDYDTGPILSMRTQLQNYLNAGGTFGDDDLVSILGGANNIFQGLTAFGSLPAGHPALANPTGYMQPIALGAAADLNFIVSEVADAGAGTILVTNLLKLSLTPQFGGTPAAPLADYAVTTMNTALLNGLFATAAAEPGSNIIYVDLFKAGDAITAIAPEYGVTNTTQVCFTGVSVCSNPDTYLYWDAVHPTAVGHRIIADLALDYMYYGDRGAQTTVQAETGYRHRETTQDMIGEALSSRAGWEKGTSLSMGVTYENAETDARGAIAGADSEGYGVNLALDAALSDTLRVGVGFALQNSDVEAGQLTFDVETQSADVWAAWRSNGGWFVNASAGVSNDNYDGIERQTTLGSLKHLAETGGNSRGARLQAGTWFDMGELALSPRVTVSHISTKVDGYVEQGAAAQYRYADRVIEATSAEAALRIEGGGERFGFYAEGGYRDAIDESFDAVVTSIVNNPAQPLARSFDDPMGKAALVSAGFDFDVTERLSVTAGYRGRFGDSTDSHMGGITLNLAL